MEKIFYLSFIFLVFSCFVKEESASNVPNQIVLIIDKCPNYSEYINESTRVLSRREDGHELTYRDDDLILHYYRTKEVPTKDTVVFPAKSKMLEIEHVYKHFENLSFIFQKGDTVLFTYENDFPVARVINRPEDFVQVNYEKIRRDYLFGDHETFDGISKFRIDPLASFPGFLAVRDIDKMRQIRLDSMEKALSVARIEKEKESHLLDSLQKQGFLSKEVYDFFNTKSKIEYGLIDYEYLYYKDRNTLAKETKQPKWPFENADSLVRYGYYNNILDFVEREFLTIDLKPKTINKKIPDYKKAYLVIKENQQLSEKERIILLTRTMENIIVNCAESEIKIYLSQYNTDVPNRALVNYIITKSRGANEEDVVKFTSDFDAQLTTSSNIDLFLLDIKGKKTTFEEIMDRNNGKLLFIDFWASHCQPCMLTIPYSKELDSLYKDQDLQIVFISIDKDKESWGKAAKKLAISSYPEHYLVDSTKTNSMLRFLDLKAIPRYLLIDQNGKLIHKNAPGPGSDEIRELLDKYLMDGN